MDAAKRALLFGAGLFLTIAFITIMVVTFSTATDASKAATNEFSSVQTELSEQSYQVYDGTTVSGSQVVNALRKFEDKDIGINVITGKGGDTWYINDASTIDSLSTASGSSSSVKDIASQEYINPSGKFQAKIQRDSNNVIRAITFEQL
jgi:hypothetical protein